MLRIHFMTVARNSADFHHVGFDGVYEEDHLQTDSLSYRLIRYQSSLHV